VQYERTEIMRLRKGGNMGSEGEIASSSAELERRVSAIEALLRARPEATTAENPYWILEGIRERTEGAGAVHYAGVFRADEDHSVEWQYGLATASLTDLAWGDFAPAVTALAHPVRLEILRELLITPKTVAELAAQDAYGTTGQIYHHVNKLVAEGWLSPTGHGRHSVPTTRVIPLLALIAILATP